MSHILVCLIIANVLVSEFISENLINRLEGVDGAFSLSIHNHGEDHNPRSSIEATDWELSEQKISYSPSEDSLLNVPVSIDRVVSLSGEIFVDVIGFIMGAEDGMELNEKDATWAISCWALALRVKKLSFLLLTNMRL